MRYASIDIETTGLDPNRDQILEFGCVLDQTELDYIKSTEIKNLPTFRAVLMHKRIMGDPFALTMNEKLIAEIRDNKNNLGAATDVYGNYRGYIRPENLAEDFAIWLLQLRYTDLLICAGKNFASFDKLFLNELPGWKDIKIKHRVIDPAMFYMHPDDKEPPKSEVCYERANIDSLVAHTAVEDAQKVCLLIRHAMKYYGTK